MFAVAAGERSFETMKELIKWTARLDCKDDIGNNLLQVAVKYNNI